MQLLFKFQVNPMKIDNFRNSADVDLLANEDLKRNWWFNSMTWFENPLQISSQWDENWGFLKYHLGCWPWAYVDLLVNVDLKNNWLVEFSDLKYKSSSIFMQLTWNLKILEISPKLMTFSPQTIGFFLITNSTMWWSLVNISLKLTCRW